MFMQKIVGRIIVFLLVLVFHSGCRMTWIPRQDKPIRIAAFNTSLYRSKAGRLYSDLHKGCSQAQSVAEIIQIVRPDIVLLNEFDHDSEHKAVRYFMQQYLAVPQNDNRPIIYPYYYTNSVNTGIPSGHDFDNDGQFSVPGDAFGYGAFPGQYGMVLLSKYPIQNRHVRTFQHFLWKEMPDALLPDDLTTREQNDWYDQSELEIFRLSSKSHWDIPVQIGSRTLHVLAAHPTPPVFDGFEDRNGRRNHDEIRFWADYITPQKGGYIYDDTGRQGGLDEDDLFVILGDLNGDPHDGDSTGDAVCQLLSHQAVCDPRPTSSGALQRGLLNKDINLSHQSSPSCDTYQSPPGQAPGNLRLDYVLPSCKIDIIGGAVFWPPKEHPMSKLIDCSDHRIVYVDIQIPGSH